MRIVWDLDGTLLKDSGKDYDKLPEYTPLMKLLRNMSEHNNICVTGRTEIPKPIKHCFKDCFPRDWIPADWNKYYPQYFQWKVDMILKIKPDLVFEDDQQITRYLTRKGLAVVWVPMYAYMGVELPIEAGSKGVPPL